MAEADVVLDALRTIPRGASLPDLLKLLPGFSSEQTATILNHLSSNQQIDMLSSPSGAVSFRAREALEASKTSNLSENERIVYQFIKGNGNRGIWVKEIKLKSGLHTQVVSSVIKSLEKNSLIKSVKSVKNPTKKVYMLFEMVPSVEITGGAW